MKIFFPLYAHNHTLAKYVYIKFAFRLELNCPHKSKRAVASAGQVGNVSEGRCKTSCCEMYCRSAIYIFLSLLLPSSSIRSSDSHYSEFCSPATIPHCKLSCYMLLCSLLSKSGTGSLTCETLVVRALHTNVRQALRSLRKCWHGRSENRLFAARLYLSGHNPDTRGHAVSPSFSSNFKHKELRFTSVADYRTPNPKFEGSIPVMGQLEFFRVKNDVLTGYGNACPRMHEKMTYTG